MSRPQPRSANSSANSAATAPVILSTHLLCTTSPPAARVAILLADAPLRRHARQAAATHGENLETVFLRIAPTGAGRRMSCVIARNGGACSAAAGVGAAAAVLAVLAYFPADRLFLGVPKLAGMPSAPGVTDLVALPLERAIASIALIVAPLLGMRAIAGKPERSLYCEPRAQAVRESMAAGCRAVRIFVVLIALALAMPASLAIGAHGLGRIA